MITHFASGSPVDKGTNKLRKDLRFQKKVKGHAIFVFLLLEFVSGKQFIPGFPPEFPQVVLQRCYKYTKKQKRTYNRNVISP